jgi:hypothetical protein
MPYTWSICDPFTPDLIEKGGIEKDAIVDTFLKHPWMELCRKMNDPSNGEPCFSPTLNFTDTDTLDDLSFSFVGDESQFDFLVFINFDEHNADRQGFDLEASKKILEAFVRGDLEYIIQKIC